MPVTEIVVPSTIGPSHEFCFAADGSTLAKIAAPTAKALHIRIIRRPPSLLFSISRGGLPQATEFDCNTRWRCKADQCCLSAHIRDVDRMAEEFL